jgi:ABC-type multidrug transport system ATPase subunit
MGDNHAQKGVTAHDEATHHVRNIEVKSLTRDFADLRAVDAVDLRIPSGEIFGFLDPNDAGKTPC